MKMNLSKGLAGRLTGGLIGGVSSAVFDRYVLPLFGASVGGYANYVKIGVGAVLPALAKNNAILDAAGDALIAVGAANVVSSLLGDGDVPAPENPNPQNISGVTMVNGSNFPDYRAYVNGDEKKKKKKKDTATASTPAVVSAVR